MNEETNAEIEKSVKYRIGNLLSDPVLLKVAQEYGWEPFRRSSVLYGLDEFLRKNNIRGKRCVEIGTFHGLTALILSRYFDEVVTIDILPSKLKSQIVALAGAGNIRFADVADNEAKAEIIERLDFDCAFMDGNHVDDTVTDFQLVSRCKNVIFQEAWQHQQPVWRLLQSLPRAEVNYGNSFAYWKGA